MKQKQLPIVRHVYDTFPCHPDVQARFRLTDSDSSGLIRFPYKRTCPKCLNEFRITIRETIDGEHARSEWKLTKDGDCP